MPLCGAVTKLTGPSPDADGCTLQALVAAANAHPHRLRDLRRGWEGRIAKKLGRRRSLAMPMYADAVLGCFMAKGKNRGARPWDAKAEEVREGGGGVERRQTQSGQGWEVAQA